MSNPHSHFAAKKTQYIEKLKELAQIPSISSSDDNREDVAACAAKVAGYMQEVGLSNVELINIEGALPYVYGEWIGGKDSPLSGGETLPTVLLYSHYDVQPVGDEQLWESAPFMPEERKGRLYGRGTSDDKAGIIAHLAAIDSYLKTTGKLPVNIKCIFEGEEEIGSVNLEKLLAKYSKKLQADYIVIADTENFGDGIPGITTQLRGLVDCEIELHALSQPLHSGQFGGPIPDPVQELVKLISKLTDKDGKIAVPGIYADIKKLSASERAALKKLPFNEKQYRAHAHMLSGTKFAGEKGYTVYEQIWHRPALSVNAIQASSRAQVSNIITASAWAHLGIRLVPNMNPKKTLNQLIKFLKANAPKNMKLEIMPGHSVSWWSANTKSPALQAAARAMKKGFGKDAVMMGSGGSIGFVEPFSRALNNAPALLMGIEDPECNAHSYNESLHIANWYKTVDSMIYLYEELAKN
ncbi:MAG: M20/M25/M40 family metallo-hydrolase [Candidatus Paceibacterota bacterium]|jgi:acetylornithine deacetylase/succinyl-diaminopimelate desuccinylase-like protein